MEEKKKSNKIMFAVLGIVIVALIGIVVFLVLKLNNTDNSNNPIENNSGETQGYKKSSDNLQVNENIKTSFANLKADDEKFDETQKTIIDYFDRNYFTDFAISELQQYPQIFKGAKIAPFNVGVVKVLKSTDEEFEVVAYVCYQGAFNRDSDIEDLDEGNLILIKGKQLEKRLVKGTFIPTLYGRYTGTEKFDIDGKSYMLPVVNAINILQETHESDKNYRFGFNDINTVAKYVFGENIKISSSDEDYYTITLDNQSNANFSKFNMKRNYGMIEYNEQSDETYKRIFVASDFQHYIVSTYDIKLKHVYVDYFDRNLKKLWGREFDYNSNHIENISPMDYTTTQMAVVIDNDLHLIDLSTGKDIIEPMLVGEKVCVNMMEDGIILIGNDNKDTFMKVSYDGKVIYRTNGNVTFDRVAQAMTQIINNKMVVHLYGYGIDKNNPEMGEFPFEKYLVLNSDGTVETETENDMAML